MKLVDSTLEILVATLQIGNTLIDTREIRFQPEQFRLRRQLLELPVNRRDVLFDRGQAVLDTGEAILDRRQADLERGNAVLEPDDLRGQCGDFAVDAVESFVHRVEVTVRLAAERCEFVAKRYGNGFDHFRHDHLTVKPHQIAPRQRPFIHEIIVPRGLTNTEEVY